ncbi:hypothetical protein [Mesobacillus persicus]|nr:hypothetical protein [Mesobacillus persicus]
MGITVDNSILGNIIVKIIGAICFVGFWKIYLKENGMRKKL